MQLVFYQLQLGKIKIITILKEINI